MTLRDSTPFRLFERTVETDAIRTALATVAGGDGAVVVFEGPAGIGKTALIEHARRQAAADGITALSARGGELEQALPFGVARQLFERLIAQPGAAERFLRGPAQLAAGVVSDGFVSEARTDDRQFAVLHGLYWLTANIAAEAPLLICVDDAHHADAGSLKWLAYLVRRLPGVPVLVVIGVRPLDTGPQAQVLREIQQQAPAATLSPLPLSLSASEGLLSRWLGQEPAPSFAAACHRATSGNPFLLGELVRAISASAMDPTDANVQLLRDAGAAGASHSVMHRLSGLAPATQRLATALAVVSDGVSMELAREVAGLDRDTASAAAEELRQQGVLSQAGEFEHPIVRDVIHRATPSVERADLHADAARLLSARAPGRLHDVAAHLLLASARQEPWVADWLRRAAGAARAEGAPETAIQYLRRARAEGAADGHSGLTLELAEAEALVRDPDATAHFREALDGAQSDADRARAASGLAAALVLDLRADETVSLLSRELDRVSDRDSRLWLTAQLLTAGNIHLDAREELLGLRRELREFRDAGTAPERSVVAALALHESVFGSSVREAASLARLALGDGRMLEDQGCESLFFHEAAMALVFSDELLEGKAAYDAALARARADGSRRGVALASCWRATINYRLGRLAEAETDAFTALSEAQSGLSVLSSAAAGYLVDALVEQDRFADAVRLVQEHSEPGGGHLLSHPLLVARARVRVLSGDIAGGLSDYRLCQERGKAWHVMNPGAVSWRGPCALAMRAAGEDEEAARLADEEVGLAQAIGSERSEGMARRVRGLLLGGDAGIDELRRAVELLEGTSAVLERARAQIDLGASLRRAGRRRDSRPPLRLGLEAAHDCGARILAARAHEELTASGARVRRVSLSGLDSLTVTERRVARMAAAGMTNRQIAQDLFVAENTVEVHLVRIYRKLDISSRKALGGFEGLRRAGRAGGEAGGERGERPRDAA